MPTVIAKWLIEFVSGVQYSIKSSLFRIELQQFLPIGDPSFLGFVTLVISDGRGIFWTRIDNQVDQERKQTARKQGYFVSNVLSNWTFDKYRELPWCISMVTTIISVVLEGVIIFAEGKALKSTA